MSAPASGLSGRPSGDPDPPKLREFCEGLDRKSRIPIRSFRLSTGRCTRDKQRTNAFYANRIIGHIEHPANRHWKPASRKIRSRPSASACALTRPEPGTTQASTLFATRLLYGYDLCSARPVDEIGRIAPRPVLIIHSTSDVLVPFDHATQLIAAAPHAETWLVTGPEHARSYNTDPPTYNQLVIDFFDRGLKSR